MSNDQYNPGYNQQSYGQTAQSSYSADTYNTQSVQYTQQQPNNQFNQPTYNTNASTAYNHPTQLNTYGNNNSSQPPYSPNNNIYNQQSQYNTQPSMYQPQPQQSYAPSQPVLPPPPSDYWRNKQASATSSATSHKPLVSDYSDLDPTSMDLRYNEINK